MRKIKFRIFDKFLNCWKEKGSWMGNYDDFYFENLEEILNDKDYIVLQFTGLKDKNGKEIYEGDIIQLWVCEKLEGLIREVKWETGISEDGHYSSGFKIDEASDSDSCEIIGNIYENPELLPQ